MNGRTLLVYMTVAAILSGCAQNARHDDNWHAALPEREHFSQVYRADRNNLAFQTEDQYLTWVMRFYEGSDLYPFGFNDLKSTVLYGVDAGRHSTLEAKLDDLGRRVAAEWAKDKRVRLVTTAMLSLWGNAMRAGVDSDHREEVMDRILADVLDLAAGRLHGNEISAERYEYGIAITVASVCSDDPEFAPEDC